MKKASKNKTILISSGIISALCLAGVAHNAFASTSAFLNTRIEVYKSASTSGGSYGNFDAQTEVTFEALKENWLLLRRAVNGKTYEGYVNNPSVVTLKDTASLYTVASNGTKLYSDSSLSSTTSTLSKGENVVIAQFINSNGTPIAYVRANNGRIGFVKTSDLSSTNDSEQEPEEPGDGPGSGQSEAEKKIESMISLAKSKIDKPYVYGAEGPNKFDCSGLTYYLFKEVMGVTIKRSAYQQGHSSSDKFNKISGYEQLKKGDIIAFDFNLDGACDHVGFYIGENKMIEASNGAGKVRLFDFNNKSNGKSYRTKYFLWGLRYKKF